MPDTYPDGNVVAADGNAVAGILEFGALEEAQALAGGEVTAVSRTGGAASDGSLLVDGGRSGLVGGGGGGGGPPPGAAMAPVAAMRMAAMAVNFILKVEMWFLVFETREECCELGWLCLLVEVCDDDKNCRTGGGMPSLYLFSFLLNVNFKVFNASMDLAERQARSKRPQAV